MEKKVNKVLDLYEAGKRDVSNVWKMHNDFLIELINYRLNAVKIQPVETQLKLTNDLLRVVKTELEKRNLKIEKI